MMNFEIYDSDQDDTVRYLLGKQGQKILLVFGVNPSTANKEKSDRTISRINNMIKTFGYDGFVMVNLFPTRATNPKDLPKDFDMNTHKENLNKIAWAIDKSSAVLLAWGNPIEERKYLYECLEEIAPIIEKSELPVFCLGVTKHGNPRHPSRGKTPTELIKFSLKEYIAKQQAI